MKYAALVLVLVIALGVLLLRPAASPPMPNYVPIADFASRKPQPSVGLIVPLPDWMPLPERGHVIGAGIYPPQPPYGASATVMLRLDEPAESFIASYRVRLVRAGFGLRSRPVLSTPLDRVELAYEADEARGGRTIYIAIRGTPAARFAQLTFWNPPSPRM